MSEDQKRLHDAMRAGRDALRNVGESDDLCCSIRGADLRALVDVVYQLSQTKPFPAPGRWFPINVLGSPMVEMSPGKWAVLTAETEDLVLRITTAYEQGFGQALRSELSNPYVEGTVEREAWDTGREEGAKRQPGGDAACPVVAWAGGATFISDRTKQNGERWTDAYPNPLIHQRDHLAAMAVKDAEIEQSDAKSGAALTAAINAGAERAAAAEDRALAAEAALQRIADGERWEQSFAWVTATKALAALPQQPQEKEQKT